MKDMFTPPERADLRRRMVERQIEARGIRSPLVLEAMGKVQREGYVASWLGEFAYDDTPLPIEEEQTISQPYIVAFMLDALDLKGGERALEVGTGSGYAAAILAEICSEVWTIERHRQLKEKAAERLSADGYDNVHVHCADGTLGWPATAPFDAIVVAAGGPRVPPALRAQLAIGGRLVIPVGEVTGLQKLVRVTRTGSASYRTEELVDVRFVPLVGAQGWHGEKRSEAPPGETAGEGEVAVAGPAPRHKAPRAPRLEQRIAAAAEPFDSIGSADLEGLLARIGDARVVLLGEATHGTSEFYRMRARITRELIERKGFGIVAVEADWPDAARVDQYVRSHYVPSRPDATVGWETPARFPSWMWRNEQMRDFIEQLRRINDERLPSRRVRFAGLDLYSLHTSIAMVLAYLDDADPDTAQVARERYGCLTPYQRDPAAYGRAALTGTYGSCEKQVVRMLDDLLGKQMEIARLDDQRYFDAVQNARLVAGAELYYRMMYYGSQQSWNLRDRHMFDTLKNLLEFEGPDAKAIVWAHNSHVGNAAATAMAARGEFNVGQLCKEEFGLSTYSIGFGTDHGTVAAASHWGGPMEIKDVVPSREGSYEHLCRTSGLPRFLLPLRSPTADAYREELAVPRLERAIGVIYRPETELASHYFQAVLPGQFDEWIWFEQTEALEPTGTEQEQGPPDLYPSGL